jgi:hypothetical protein
LKHQQSLNFFGATILTKCLRTNCKTRKQTFLIDVYEVKNNEDMLYQLKPIGQLSLCSPAHIIEFFQEQWPKYVDIWAKTSELKFDPTKLQFIIHGNKLTEKEIAHGKSTIIDDNNPLEFRTVEDIIKFFTPGTDMCSCGQPSTCECTSCGKQMCEECFGTHTCEGKDKMDIQGTSPWDRYANKRMDWINEHSVG